MDKNGPQTALYCGEVLGRYGFGDEHPFGTDRQHAFLREFEKQGLCEQVVQCESHQATQVEIERFHTHAYVERVKALSKSGSGFVDSGDTPAFKGVYEVAATVVGSAIKAAEGIMAGDYRRAFLPIAGLHHARRDCGAGFCVFNDCGVVIETLLQKFGLTRVAYVDIDAHHGDGVYYAFESSPEVIFVDLHEDGHYLYPGTGSADEAGSGDAKGSKLNIPMPPGADDEAFFAVWPQVEVFLRNHRPQFILLQCGADSLAGDPITHLRYSAAAHGYAAKRLSLLAEELCQGRILALGGGGYNRENLAKAWCAVVDSFIGRGLLSGDREYPEPPSRREE